MKFKRNSPFEILTIVDIEIDTKRARESRAEHSVGGDGGARVVVDLEAERGERRGVVQRAKAHIAQRIDLGGDGERLRNTSIVGGVPDGGHGGGETFASDRETRRAQLQRNVERFHTDTLIKCSFETGGKRFGQRQRQRNAGRAARKVGGDIESGTSRFQKKT